MLSHVMDALQTNLAHHTRDVFGVWGGAGGIIINVIVIIIFIVVFKKNVKRSGYFPEHYSTPLA